MSVMCYNIFIFMSFYLLYFYIKILKYYLIVV